MDNEIHFLGIANKIYSINLPELSYFVFDDELSRDKVKDRFSADNLPNIVYSKEQQYKGKDFQYKNITLDLKVNSARYERAFFELIKTDSGLYTYDKPKDSHIIISVMKSKGLIYSIPASMIEGIVNRNISLELPQNFYYDDTYYVELGKHPYKDKYCFSINPDILQACLRQYLAYNCNNGDTRYLLTQCIPYSDSYDYKEIDKS